jgi:hypothetical protein
VHSHINILNIKMQWIYKSKNAEHVLRTLHIYKYIINEQGVKFKRLCVYLLKLYFLKATVQVANSLVSPRCGRTKFSRYGTA